MFNFRLGNIVVVVFFLVLCAPYIRVGNIGLRIEDFFLLILAIALLQSKVGGANVSAFEHGYFVLLLILTPISIFYGMSLSQVSYADWWDLSKILTPLKAIILYLALDRLRLNVQINKTMNCESSSVVDIAAVILILANFSQYFDLFGLNALYVSYIAPTQYESLLKPFGRVVGTIGNPNYNGFVLGLLAIFYFRIFSISNKLRYLLIIFLIFACIVFAGSRTALLSLFFAVIIELIYSRGRLGLGFYLMLMVALVYILNSFELVSIERLNRVRDIENETSIFARIVAWEDNIGAVSCCKLLGLGPFSGANLLDVDSSYIYLYRTHGFIGLSIYLIPFVFSVFMQKSNNSQIFNSNILPFAAYILISMLTANYFSASQLVLIIVFFMHKNSYIILFDGVKYGVQQRPTR